MPIQKPGYTILPFPPIRQLIVDSGRASNRKHTIRGLFEVDVTRVRKFIREHKEQTGESLSFTAFVIACLGSAMESNKQLHAYRNWRNQLVVFDDVDVLTYVEIELDGGKFPLAHVLRAVNRSTWREIHQEIRAVQKHPEKTPNANRRQLARWFLLLPGFVRDLVYFVASRNPHAWKKFVGTVYLTSVGMFGNGGGWGIGFSAHTTGIILGGVSERPVIQDGQLVVRECLNVTAEFDHDLIDGAPAARFIETFKTLIESGQGLT